MWTSGKLPQMNLMSIAPGPRGIPFLGNLTSYMLNPIGFLTDLNQRYGDIVRFKLGPQEAYLFNDPALIKEVLVSQHKKFSKGDAIKAAERLLGQGLLTSEGDFHLQQRRMMQPSFHRQKISQFSEIMTDYTQRTTGRWKDGQIVNLSEELRQLALAIIAKTMFNVDIEEKAQELGKSLDLFFGTLPILTLPIFENFDQLPIPVSRKFRKAKEHLDDIIYGIIEDRRKQGSPTDDLLSMLLEAQDEGRSGAKMTDRQIHDETMTLFLAGHETTANALAWVWYALSKYPRCEAKLMAEIDTVLANRTLQVEDIPKLKFTKMFLSEVLRLFPPAWNIPRKTIVPFQTGKFEIPAGSIILMSPYIMHRNEKSFPQPERFDPERWADEEEVKKRPTFSFFPFGGGPRTCIAESFAWMEMTLVVVNILRRWKLSVISPESIYPQALFTLRPKPRIQARAHLR